MSYFEVLFYILRPVQSKIPLDLRCRFTKWQFKPVATMPPLKVKPEKTGIEEHA